MDLISRIFHAFKRVPSEFFRMIIIGVIRGARLLTSVYNRPATGWLIDGLLGGVVGILFGSLFGGVSGVFIGLLIGGFTGVLIGGLAVLMSHIFLSQREN